MNFSGKDILGLLFFTAVFFGCSTQKNTPFSRSYHNLISHYNIYFNARQNVKTGLQRIENTVQDDYTHILPVYKTSIPEAGKTARSEMDLALLKCNKLIDLHSIKRKPKSLRNKKIPPKENYNRWVDDSYFLMGQASYFNHEYHDAEANFQYLVNKFPESPIRYKGMLWLAKDYIEIGDSLKTLELLKVTGEDKKFPSRLKKELEIAKAHFYIKNNQPGKAIQSLQLALQSHFPKNERMRYHFILAQLLSTLGQSGEAVSEYHKVIKMKPVPQMDFNARISILEFSDEKEAVAQKQLEKLLRDKDNQEYSDRIYYSMGRVALKNNRKSEALNDFRLSVKNSTSNNYQRALSSLSAASLYFEANDYAMASCYYDSAMAVIDNNYPDYREIKTRAESLRRLAQNLNTIQREDSLQKLAAMPEAQRIKTINQLISKLKESESQNANTNLTSAADQNYFRAQQYRPQIRIDDSQNQWYFYNPTTVGIGKAEFQRTWGKRKLEDNWRRNNKISVNPDEMDQLVQEVNQTGNSVKKKADPKTVDYYLQDLPLTDSLKKKSDERLKAALYNAGKIYQEDFHDFPKGIQSLEQLNGKFPESVYELPSWFELYRMNEQSGNQVQALVYKNKIIQKYSGSTYAAYLQNPNYIQDYQNRNSVVETKYAEALKNYQAGNYTNAHQLAAEIMVMNPDSSITSKARFLEIITGDTTKTHQAMAVSLENFMKQFPKSSVTPLARQIRNLIQRNSFSDYQQLIKRGYISDTTQMKVFKPAPQPTVPVAEKGVPPAQTTIVSAEKINTQPAASVANPKPALPLENYKGPYKTKINGENIYAFVFQTEGADTTLLKNYFSVLTREYRNNTLNVRIKPMDDFRCILTISRFADLASALAWYKKLIDSGVLPAPLQNINYRHFIITPENLEILLKEKNLTPYLNFFKTIDQD